MVDYLAIEKRINRSKKLYIQSTKFKPIGTAAKFIEDFLSNYNKGMETYYKCNGKLQCKPNCNRSLGNIYSIVKNYYPEITLKEVIKILYSLTKAKKIGVTYCNDIQKRVFFCGNYNDSYMKNTEDEYKMIWVDYKTVNKKK